MTSHVKPLTLTGTVAVVTGASSGIGEATARQFAELGATVVLAARRKDRLAQLAKELGKQALAVEVDVADANAVQSLFDQVMSAYGRVDTLVNNAGVMLIGPAHMAPLDEWKQMVDVNVMGVLNCTKIALPYLVEAAKSAPRNVADIVNVSSVAGRKAQPGSAVYSATKFAVGAFSDGIRQELASQHVRVTLVEPGFTDTELASHINPAILEKMQAAMAQMPRMTAHEVADSISFAVTRPAGVSISEILIRPTEQER
jgi:NADP-dependent 3-hydroxy acid dehydrogenase YdfG